MNLCKLLAMRMTFLKVFSVFLFKILRIVLIWFSFSMTLRKPEVTKLDAKIQSSVSCRFARIYSFHIHTSLLIQNTDNIYIIWKLFSADDLIYRGVKLFFCRSYMTHYMCYDCHNMAWWHHYCHLHSQCCPCLCDCDH